MLGYLSVDIICLDKQTLFESEALGKLRALRHREMFFERKSIQAYMYVFSCQMVAVVFIIAQVFYATCRIFSKLWNNSWIFLSFSLGIFSHVIYLDQLHASEDIRWIIMFIVICS